jgi:F-type H+-transporting ATPase subunit b
MRKSLILENISEAEKKREDSELKIKEFEEIDERSKNEANNFLNQAKVKLTKSINLKKKTLEKELSEEIQKVETEIQELKNKAPERINKIAVETSADLLQQLIGADVNSSSISAIVDDLSRKKLGKYNGN